MLSYILKLPSNTWLKQRYVLQKIKPYIDTSQDKKRLIEVPSADLKLIQKRLKNLIMNLPIPYYVFSGVKGKSYVDNAQFHKGNKYLFKIDIKSFFPNTSRGKVYDFFYYKLKMSPDISAILTNITTVDLDKINTPNKKEIDNFLLDKKIKCRNHLISGSPTSPILSYYATKNMFDELYKVSIENKLIMTIYIDDVIFSSNLYISSRVRRIILDIVTKYGYHVSNRKIKLYNKYSPKKVTGVIINSAGNLAVPNALQYKIINTLRLLKTDTNNIVLKNRLRGYINSARQIEKGIFPSIYNYIKSI